MPGRKDKRTPWVVPDSLRKHASKKFRDTLKQIKTCRREENWECVTRLKRLLMKSWWGLKRYKNKLK